MIVARADTGVRPYGFSDRLWSPSGWSLWEQASRLRRSVQVTDAKNETALAVARAGSREFAACEASGGRSNRASLGERAGRTGAFRSDTGYELFVLDLSAWLAPNEPPLFADDFESNDMAAWSSTVP